MNAAEHKQEAERLINEGRKVITTISDLADARAHLAMQIVDGTKPNDQQNENFVEAFAHQMDEQGKKAHGIWLQVIGHALLAGLPADLDNVGVGQEV